MDDPYSAANAYGVEIGDEVAWADSCARQTESILEWFRVMAMQVLVIRPTRPFRLLPRRRTGGNMTRDGPA